MIREDRARIIHGLVSRNGSWISIERKIELENQYRRRIEQGMVLFQGEWMSIDEKLRRVSPPPAARQPPQTIVHTTVNRQVYNISRHTDNRTYNVHEHRHVHLDRQALDGGPNNRPWNLPAENQLNDNTRGRLPSPGPEKPPGLLKAPPNGEPAGEPEESLE